MRPRWPGLRIRGSARGAAGPGAVGLRARLGQRPARRLRGGARGSPRRGRALAIQQVAHGENRMPPEHPWPGVPHDGLDLVAVGGLVTMDRALGAGGLFRLEHAPLQTQSGVVQEGLAFRAKTAPGAVRIVTVDRDHRGEGPVLTNQSWMWQSHAQKWRRTIPACHNPRGCALTPIKPGSPEFPACLGCAGLGVIRSRGAGTRCSARGLRRGPLWPIRSGSSRAGRCSGAVRWLPGCR